MQFSYMALPGVSRISEMQLLHVYGADITKLLDPLRDLCCEFYHIDRKVFHTYKKRTTAGRIKGLTGRELGARQMFCYIVKRELFSSITHKVLSNYVMPEAGHTFSVDCCKTFQDRLDTKEVDPEVYQLLLMKANSILETLWLTRKT